MRRRFGTSYKPPAVDGPKARSGAMIFLTNARSLDAVTAESLARNHRLKVETAAEMLATEQGRRGTML